jgi:hypothetical protein
MSSSIPFYPQHCEPTDPVHMHWLVRDGSDIPFLDSTSFLVRKYAQLLRQPPPPGTSDAELLQIWFEPQSFSTAIHTLIAKFGLENTEIRVVTPTEDGFDRFVLDVDSLNHETGIQWPSWVDWINGIKQESLRMNAYAEQLEMEPLDWCQLIWEQCLDAKTTYGHRIRPIPALRGTSPFDNHVQFLLSRPLVLVALDDWVDRLARSSLLDRMVVRGVIDSDGSLYRPLDVQGDMDSIALCVGIQPGTVS